MGVHSYFPVLLTLTQGYRQIHSDEWKAKSLCVYVVVCFTSYEPPAVNKTLH